MKALINKGGVEAKQELDLEMKRTHQGATLAKGTPKDEKIKPKKKRAERRGSSSPSSSSGGKGKRSRRERGRERSNQRRGYKGQVTQLAKLHLLMCGSIKLFKGFVLEALVAVAVAIVVGLVVVVVVVVVIVVVVVVIIIIILILIVIVLVVCWVYDNSCSCLRCGCCSFFCCCRIRSQKIQICLIHQLKSPQGLADVLVASGDEDMFKTTRFRAKGRREPSLPPSAKSTAAPSGEDLLREFLDEELKTFFPQRADAALFLKTLAADGLEPWVFF